MFANVQASAGKRRTKSTRAIATRRVLPSVPATARVPGGWRAKRAAPLLQGRKTTVGSSRAVNNPSTRRETGGEREISKIRSQELPRKRGKGSAPQPSSET